MLQHLHCYDVVFTQKVVTFVITHLSVMIRLSLTIFYTMLTMSLHFFDISCVAQVFTKYRFSFKLTKCDFFKPHVEFVGHDLTTDGNFPAESKLDLIQH